MLGTPKGSSWVVGDLVALGRCSYMSGKDNETATDAKRCEFRGVSHRGSALDRAPGLHSVEYDRGLYGLATFFTPVNALALP